MKKIGIIGAMELEVEELKSQMEEVCVKEKSSTRICVQTAAFTLPIPERTTTTSFPFSVP